MLFDRQHVVNARDQFGRIDRLGQKIAGSQFQCPALGRLIGRGRQNHHRQMRPALVGPQLAPEYPAR